jgi:3-hydroxyisobutyrate dehydrogenase
MADKQTVAVLGAGSVMGRAMARNIARGGLKVRAWNRSREKAEPLTEDGAQVCGSPAEAAQGADIILTMVADADAVISCMDGDEGALGADHADDAIWLQASTIGIEGTERCSELARDAGVEFVDAPVLGTKQPAEEGKLIVLASGPDRVRDRVQPVFDLVGQRTMWVGGAGAGTRLKLATNAWLLSVVEGAAESLALAEGLGVDPQLVLEALSGGPLDLPYLQMKGKAMIERSFAPSFRLSLAAKDAGLVQDAAERYGLDLPMLRAIRDRLDEGKDEHGDEDMSATYLTSAPAVSRR